MDINDSKRHGDEEISNLYINRDKYFNDIKALEYDDDPVYTRMINKGKLQTINVYNNIGGLRPYMPEDNFDTTTKRFNHEISKNNSNKETKNGFYTKIYK